MADSSTQRVLFPDLIDRSLVAMFDRPHASSDGGALLLRAADRRLGLMTALTGCLHDRRDPTKVRHGVDELFAQRVYGLACGYEDANDVARLGDDPIHKLLVGRGSWYRLLAWNPWQRVFLRGVEALRSPLRC